MKLHHTISLLVLGLLSGFITVYIIEQYGPLTPLSENNIMVRFVAGLVFGAIVGAYYIVHNYVRSMIWKFPLFVAGSTFAYYVAYMTARFTAAPLLSTEIKEIFNVLLFLSGATGALILTIAFMALFQKFSIKYAFILVFVGGVLGLPAFYGGDFRLDTLFILWQGGMAAALGYVLDKNKKQSDLTYRAA